MDNDIKALDSGVETSGLRELAYWGALIIANAACLGLMVMLLLRG